MFVLKKEKGICFMGLQKGGRSGRGGGGGHGNVAGGGCAGRGGSAGSGGMGKHFEGGQWSGLEVVGLIDDRARSVRWLLAGIFKCLPLLFCLGTWPNLENGISSPSI